jgi:uncharacterized membrane protein (DUF106 family)
MSLILNLSTKDAREEMARIRESMKRLQETLERIRVTDFSAAIRRLKCLNGTHAQG